jgi:hypothetical protein
VGVFAKASFSNAISSNFTHKCPKQVGNDVAGNKKMRETQNGENFVGVVLILLSEFASHFSCF